VIRETYRPEAPACGSTVAPGIHSLALRDGIGFVRAFVAGVISARSGPRAAGQPLMPLDARSRNCPPVILAPQVLGIFTVRFTSS
jgi:hypothetical protein